MDNQYTIPETINSLQEFLDYLFETKILNHKNATEELNDWANRYVSFPISSHDIWHQWLYEFVGQRDLIEDAYVYELAKKYNWKPYAR